RRNSRLAKPWRMKRKSQSPPKNSQAQTRIASAFIRRLLRRLHVMEIFIFLYVE
ncbi:MAG: hypothetical protein ACI9DF_005981, partial [Verrucomicrobiales bacterium]